MSSTSRTRPSSGGSSARGTGSHRSCHGGGYDIRRLRRRERNEAHAVGVVRVSRTRHLDREPRLAYATGADEREQPPAAEEFADMPDVLRAPHGVRGGSGTLNVAGGVDWALGAAFGGSSEVLPQDQAVKPLKVGSGRSPLGDEAPRASREAVTPRPGARIGTGRALADRERVPQRMLLDELMKLRDKVRVAAEIEIRGDPVLEHGDAEIFEPPDLGLRKRFVAEVGERRPTPQRESSLESVGGASRVTGGQRFPAGGGHVLEALEVELAAVSRSAYPGARVTSKRLGSPVAGPARAFAAGATPLPAGRLWRRKPLFAPQRCDQAVARDHLVRVQQQQSQQRPLLYPAEARPRSPSSTSSGPRILKSTVLLRP